MRRVLPRGALDVVMMTRVLAAVLAAGALTAAAPAGLSQVPQGLRPIFNGRDLTGWHISRTNHHGATASYTVKDGVLLMQQKPFGQGGLLLTDKIYKDFDLYLEAKPDPAFNSGIFLRSTESGSAYQIELQAPGDSTGNLFGERMPFSQPRYIGEKVSVSTVWKTGEWNSLRIRMTGEAPHVTVWVNGTQLYELQMPQNDQIAGIYGGMIGLQLHWTATYSSASGRDTSTRPWQLQRFRNIAIKEIDPAPDRLAMEFVLIQPGRFTLGRFQPPYLKTPETDRRIEAAALADSSQGFEVTIARPYYLGKYEVTQAQYRRVMGVNPSVFQGDDRPVDSVSWDDAQAFVRKLNALEKTNVYRLPTEFEWEYAARAGADDDIPWPEIRPQAFNSGQTTQAVGKMQPNKWGLYDMLGNVWEWTQDFYNGKIFADPKPAPSGTEHVLKGGGFTSDVKNLTYMWHGAGPGNKFDVGFRIARDAR
jgi:formylglycine-generating enzyme